MTIWWYFGQAELGQLEIQLSFSDLFCKILTAAKINRFAASKRDKKVLKQLPLITQQSTKLTSTNHIVILARNSSCGAYHLPNLRRWQTRTCVSTRGSKWFYIRNSIHVHEYRSVHLSKFSNLLYRVWLATSHPPRAQVTVCASLWRYKACLGMLHQ